MAKTKTSTIVSPEMAFGLAVREFREHLGFSQERLGFEANLHRTYISDVERGMRNPTVRIVWRLAHALQIMPVELIASAQKRCP